jgi:hypothetical protein
MYRSQEIIQILNEYNLPYEISKYILEIERKINFKNSLYDWMHFSFEAREAKVRRFFYEENNDFFLNEIKDIQGDFNLLKKQKLKLWHVKRKMNSEALLINSMRF